MSELSNDLEGFQFTFSKLNLSFATTSNHHFSTYGDDIKNPNREIDFCFQPLVHLPLVDTTTLEENEQIVFFAERARIYRWIDYGWKERGTGSCKILKNCESDGVYRIVMRREKTLKLCANHLILSDMNLHAHEIHHETCWVYNTQGDLIDSVDSTAETLAIRFRSMKEAQEFQKQFILAQEESKLNEKVSASDGPAKTATENVDDVSKTVSIGINDEV